MKWNELLLRKKKRNLVAIDSKKNLLNTPFSVPPNKAVEKILESDPQRFKLRKLGSHFNE